MGATTSKGDAEGCSSGIGCCASNNGEIFTEATAAEVQGRDDPAEHGVHSQGPYKIEVRNQRQGLETKLAQGLSKQGKSSTSETKAEEDSPSLLGLFGFIQRKNGRTGSLGIDCVFSNGELIVNKLHPAGPAESSGQVRVQDVVLELDGNPCYTVENPTEHFCGEVGSSAVLKLKRNSGLFGLLGDEIVTVTLTRMEVNGTADAADRSPLGKTASLTHEHSLNANSKPDPAVTSAKGREVTFMWRAEGSVPAPKYSVYIHLYIMYIYTYTL